MIGESRRKLDAWIQQVTGPVAVSPEPPGTHDAPVSAYLLALAPRPGAGRTDRRPGPARVGVRFLVTTHGEDADDLLDRLVVAAMEDDELVVDADPPEPSLWTALGQPPRPALFLEVEAAATRSSAPAPLVRRPLVADLGPSREVTGTVVGGDGTPIPGARVEVAGLQRAATADAHGNFRLPVVPDNGTAHLRVTVRGRELVTTADLADDEPVVIRCDLEEEI